MYVVYVSFSIQCIGYQLALRFFSNSPVRHRRQLCYFFALHLCYNFIVIALVFKSLIEIHFGLPDQLFHNFACNT